MLQGWAVIGTAFVYLLLLFGVASFGDRKRLSGQLLSRPNIYALSLAIYCTTWTFFGSVGMASHSGLNFLAIYVGPILLFTLGFPLVRRIVQLSKQERITSVADFLGARYGKSIMVAVVATLIVVVGTVPYIALQLKAISNSVSTLISRYSLVPDQEFFALGEISILISITLALFTILFGTRHADATEHQDGLMLAVAVESAVKLAAFLLVGFYVTYFLFDGFSDVASQARSNPQVNEMMNAGIDTGNFLILTLLSMLVFLLLPRQFHVAVVENHSPGELERGRWMFPLYLVLINLFVIPIAIGGLVLLEPGVNPDDYVLFLPMSQGNDFITMAAFIGGLSAGAAMVVVACVALAIMISNDLVLPVIVKQQARGMSEIPASMEPMILRIRRSSILVLLFAAYAYYRAADNTQALASIGLVSFAAIVQLAPAFFGGLFWHGANTRGAIAGMVTGFAVWAYCLLIPTLLPTSHWLVTGGPLGNGLLKPSDLFELGLSPIANGVIWSLFFNTCALVLVSLTRLPTNNEQAQATVFVATRPPITLGRRGAGSQVSISELIATVSRYLGRKRTLRAFEIYWQEKGERPRETDPVDSDLLRHSEQLLASAIGASSSRLVHNLLLKRFEPGSPASIKLLDQASEALRYNRDVLQTALDQLDQGITVFDAEFRLAFWNKRYRRMLNLPPSIGQAGIPLNEVTREIASVQSLKKQGVSGDQLADRILNETEPWLLALDKSERIMEISTAPMPGGGVVVTWNDITERILVAEALREANETLERRVEERTSELVKTNQKLERATRAADDANASKTRFLAAAGHDIMQPLNAARLYTSTLQERLEESNGTLAANISKSLESVEDILGAVLAISRLDTGRQDIKWHSFPVRQLFDQMEVEFSPFAGERGVELRFVESSAWVRSDPGLLRRLLQNLISNAIKYTPAGKVLVGCRRRGSQVNIEVIDTGIGIEEKDIGEIFTEFHRLKDGEKHAFGLGLGLSIVERISKLLGHKVELESLPGAGTRFAVCVPVAAARSDTVRQVPANRGGGQKLEGLSVLCIDNEPSILEGMAGLLTQWGCSAHTALSSEQAIDVVRQMPSVPDMVLADYHLQDETGIEAVRKLRATFGEELACVLVTADRTPAVRSLAEEEDMPVLHKPVRPAALRAMLSSGKVRRVAAE